MILTYKYRLRSRRASRVLRRHARAVNQVWNYCVETQKKVQRAWKDGLSVSWPSRLDLQGMTVGTSKDLGIHAHSVQDACERFVRSRDTHKKLPGFRASSGPKRKLGWVPFQAQSRKLSSDSITYLGQTFRFFGVKRRPLPDVVKGGMFVEDSRGTWYACLHVEVEELAASPDIAVGIDLGLKAIATLSDGTVVDNPRATAAYAERLATAQRAGNKARVKAINAKIKNARADHLHKASAKIAASYRTIFVGNVSSSKLVKTRLAKSVTDASWSNFKQHLRYKASRHGGQVHEVDERFTTQTCSQCGALPPERPIGIAGLGIRSWSCSACGACHDRDVNAALNILRIGLSVQPRVDESPRSQ